MEYIRRDYYTGLYGEISETDFNRLSWDACRLIDRYTTGIDNVKKLKIAFPTDADDSEIVKRCACEVVNLLYRIQQAENSAAAGKGYESTEQGMRGKVISSITAGNESVTYSVGGNSSETAIDTAVKDASARENYIANTIRGYLSGVTDANGVNLLYMGAYPRRYLC